MNRSSRREPIGSERGRLGVAAHDASKLVPLPFRVRPLQCETTKSFRERIATRNHISASAWPLNSRGSELKFVLARLALISPVALVTALPELRSASDIAEYPHLAGMVAASAPIRPACQLCVAARDGQAAGATVFASHEQVICYRHNRWTGGGTLRCSANEQFSVSSVPEVPSANVRHRRLIVRFGRGAVHTTFHDAVSAMLYWHDWSAFARDPGISHRRQALGLPPDIHGHNPRDIATWYPNTVAMTELVLPQLSGGRGHRGALPYDQTETTRRLASRGCPARIGQPRRVQDRATANRRQPCHLRRSATTGRTYPRPRRRRWALPQSFRGCRRRRIPGLNRTTAPRSYSYRPGPDYLRWRSGPRYLQLHRCSTCRDRSRDTPICRLQHHRVQ